MEPSADPGPAEQPDPIRKKTSTVNSFIQYSGLGVQMLATIGIGVWAGSWLDKHQGNHTPIWTLVLALVSIGASIYLLIRGLPKQS